MHDEHDPYRCDDDRDNDPVYDCQIFALIVLAVVSLLVSFLAMLE